MTITRGLTTVAGTAIVTCLVGTTVGFCLGAFAPSLYRQIFTSGSEPEFKPIEVGIGLGCVQGLVAGVVIGLVIVLAVTWYEVRMAEIRARSIPGGSGGTF